ncbi:hypothetical protein J7M23_05010 [Candidatus Sumerlaeota bacterium]|nr:hypothetical protein [Candidatus Sumerlaeota bacterium]
MKKQKTKNSAERIRALLDLYGALLTRKQQQYSRLHYIEGKSFSDIASQFRVSRQSIYDTVRQSVTALEGYEKKLKLLDRFGKEQPQRLPISSTQETKEMLSQLKQALITIQRRILHEQVIYNTDWLLRELDNLISLLNKE